MIEAAQSWIERAAGNAGVLACGLRLADRSFLARSCRAEVPEARVIQALRDLSEAVYALQQNRVPVERLRWTFENGQIRCVAGPGGMVAALLLMPEAADLPGIDQLLEEFAVKAQ